MSTCGICGVEIGEEKVLCDNCMGEFNEVEGNPYTKEQAQEISAPKEAEMICLRCGSKMESMGIQKIQLGQTGFFTGTLSNLLSGALDVEIYVCQQCKKMEFYAIEFYAAE